MKTNNKELQNLLPLEGPNGKPLPAIFINEKAFAEASRKTPNYIQQAIDPAQAINGDGFVPQITPDQQQKPRLKKLEIIEDSQKLADLQGEFDKLYQNFLFQIESLITKDTKDFLLKKLQCPKLIKDGPDYKLITEDKNIAEVIKDVNLSSVLERKILTKFPYCQEIACDVVSIDGLAIRYISEDLELKKYKDKLAYDDISLAAVIQNPLALQYVKPHLLYNPSSYEKIAIAAVSQDGLALKHVQSKFGSNEKVVRIAVSQNGLALDFASEDLRKNKEIVSAAVSQNPLALQYANTWLMDSKSYKELVSAADSQDGMALEFANKDLQKDKEVILAAVKQNGLALYYASEELRKDKEVVLVAIKQNPSALQYASEELRKDKEVVLVAIKQNPSALQYASEELRKDKEVVLVAVSQDGMALAYASPALQKDKDVVLAAIKQNPSVLLYASELRKDRNAVLAAVKQDGMALLYVHRDLRANKEIVSAAVSQNPLAFIYIKDQKLRDSIFKELNLADNKEFIQLLIENEFSKFAGRQEYKVLTDLGECIDWEGEEKVYLSAIEIEALRQNSNLYVEEAITEILINNSLEKSPKDETIAGEKVKAFFDGELNRGDGVTIRGNEFFYPLPICNNRPPFDSSSFVSKKATNSQSNPINTEALKTNQKDETTAELLKNPKSAVQAHITSNCGNISSSNLKSNSENDGFKATVAGNFINGTEPPIRIGKVQRFTNIEKNLDLTNITQQNCQAVVFTFNQKQLSTNNYGQNALLSNEIALEPSEALQCLSLSCKDDLEIICTNKNINKDINKDNFTVTQDDCGFYYITADKTCNIQYVVHNNGVQIAENLPEGGVKALYQEYTNTKLGFKESVTKQDNKYKVPDYPSWCKGKEGHKKWLNLIYNSRLGVCRHRTMAFFYKAVNEGINKKDLRMVGINGNHVIIEAKNGENWYQLDLGGGSATITKTAEALKPKLVETKKIEAKKAVELLNTTTTQKASISEIEKNKEAKLKTDQQQKNQNNFNTEFSKVLQNNIVGNILIADTSGIGDDDVGSAFNVAVSMLSKDNNTKNNGESLFIVNSPADLDLTSDQLVLNSDNPEIRVGGKLLEFVNSSTQNKTIIVNWQNFNEQQKVAYNSLLDRVQMIDGKEISPIIRVISVENSGNADLSFNSRHQIRIAFECNDSKNFVSKNYPQISNDNASAQQPLVVDIAGLNDYKQVLFGRVNIANDQKLAYEKSPFVSNLSSLTNQEEGQEEVKEAFEPTNHAKKVVIKNLKDDKKQELEQQIALAKSCGYFNYFGKKIPCPKDLAIEFDIKTFDFTAIENSIQKLSENQIFSQEHHQDYHLINPHIFEQLVVNSKIESEKYIEEAGLIKQNAGNTLRLYISTTLADNQYYYLFSQANKHNVKLDLALAPNVKLPRILVDKFKNISEEDLDEDYNDMLANNLKTMRRSLVLKKPDTNSKIHDTNSKIHDTNSKIHLSKDQNQSRQIADKLKKENQKLHIIDVEDLIWQQDFIAKSFKKERDAENKLIFNKFSTKEGEIISRLKEGKNIALKGEFSEDMLHILQPIILKTGDYKNFGNLSLIIENKDKRAVEQCFSCLNKDDIVDLPLAEQQIQEEIKEKSKIVEFFEPKIDSEEFINQRLETLTSTLAKEPMLRLIGHSGVGKTSLVKTLAKDREDQKSNFSLYCEMSALEEWAKDSTENKTKILFIDEANIDNLHYTTFNPLKEVKPGQDKIEIYYNGKFHQLTKDHKVVFAGNPNSYGGGRAEQKLFANNAVKEIELQDFPKSYIYEQLLKAEIFDKLTKDQSYQIQEEKFQKICTDQIQKYQQQKAQNLNIKNQDTVRELQENVMLAIKNQQLIQEELQEIKNRNYITTEATKDNEAKLNDFIQIREQNQQKNITAGLNGFLIYGPSGIGKSEMARAILESQGYTSYQKSQESSEEEVKSQPEPKKYCYIASSLSIARKKELIIGAFRNNWPIMIDEINCCADDGLEKVLNSALTGYDPENGNKQEKNGFFMIATANKVSAQTQGGRKNLSPAIIHRCNKIDLKGLTAYGKDDIEKIIKHQQKQNLIDKTIEINSNLIVEVQKGIVSNKINLRNLSAWANENYGGKAIEADEPERNIKPKEYLHTSTKNFGRR